jgi:hypothetical protein
MIAPQTMFEDRYNQADIGPVGTPGRRGLSLTEWVNGRMAVARVVCDVTAGNAQTVEA